MSVLLGREKIARSLMAGETLKVIDPACGTGGFLVYLLKETLEFLERALKSNLVTTATKQNLDKRAQLGTFFGADANDSVASAAKMNMIVAGDGHSNIHAEDSLSARSRIWSVTNPDVDVVMTNPPFGTSEGDSLGPTDLSQFPVPTSKGQLLFLEKMIQCVKPGSGEICTVIDEGVLNTDIASALRTWVLRHAQVKTIVKLPEVTFKPNKINVRAAVLHLHRLEVPDVDEERNYNVRFLEVHNLGYLGSGDPIRGFDETELMRQLQDFIASHKSDAHFESWSAFSVPVSKIYSDAQRRLDLKYWDPRVTGAIAALEQRGCPTLQDLAVTEIKRGKSPPAESYVDEQDGYALVVKAGSNITKYGELVQVGDFIEKQLFEEMPDINLRKGDILLASTGTGTLGKCSVYRSDKPAIADGHVTIIRVATDRVYPEYICDYLRLGFGATQIQRLYTGSTGLIELTPEQVKGIIVELESDLNRQTEISNKLRSIERSYRNALISVETAFEQARNEFFRAAPLGPSLIHHDEASDAPVDV